MSLFGFLRANPDKLAAKGDVAGLLALARSDPERRAKAFECLETVLERDRDETAMGPLVEGLSDADAEVRGAAAGALAHLPSPAATGALVELTERRGQAPGKAETGLAPIFVLRKAVAALRAHGDPSAVPALSALLSAVQAGLEDGDPLVPPVLQQILAMDVAKALREAGTIQALTAYFAHVDRLEEKLQAAGPDGREALDGDIRAVRNGERDVRQGWDLAMVEELARSRSASARLACVEELDRFRLEETAAILSAMASDRSTPAASKATELLCEKIRTVWPRPGVLETVQGLAESEIPQVAAAARERLPWLERVAEEERREAAKPQIVRDFEAEVRAHGRESAARAVAMAEGHSGALPPDLVTGLADLFQRGFAYSYYPSDDAEAWRAVQHRAADLLRRAAADPGCHAALGAARSAANAELDRDWQTDTAHEHAQRHGWAATASLIDSLLPTATPPPEPRAE